MIDLSDVLKREGIPAESVPIIKDRYVVHHNNLGGCMFIYFEEGGSNRIDDAFKPWRIRTASSACTRGKRRRTSSGSTTTASATSL